MAINYYRFGCPNGKFREKYFKGCVGDDAVEIMNKLPPHLNKIYIQQLIDWDTDPNMPFMTSNRLPKVREGLRELIYELYEPYKWILDEDEGCYCMYMGYAIPDFEKIKSYVEVYKELNKIGMRIYGKHERPFRRGGVMHLP